MAQQGKTKLLIADDHEMLRSGLKRWLADTEIKIIAAVANGQAAVKYALGNDLDVVLLDVRMPNGDGMAALGRIKLDKPELPIVMYSAFDNPAYIARAAALGANGYLLKSCTRDELVNTIKTAAAGRNAWTRAELYRVRGTLVMPRLNADIESPLTQREIELVRHMAGGLTNRQIAEVLKLTYETVKEYVQHIMREVGLTDRTQVAVWAVRKGLA